MYTVEQLREAQLRFYPSSIFVSTEELARLVGRDIADMRWLDDDGPGVCYVIPRLRAEFEGQPNDRSPAVAYWFGRRFGTEPGDYISFYAG